jgi:hypothetical protein
MAITIREEQDAGTDTLFAQISFTTGAGLLTTDKLLLIQSSDYYTAAEMTAPTGTAGTAWTLQVTVDNGTNATHTKVWTSDVALAGAQTVLVNTSTTGDDQRYAALFVLTGAASGIDGVASTPNGASSTSHVAPTVTPTSGQSDDLLICFWCSRAFDPGANSIVNYTMPGGMTAYTECDVSTWATFRSASQLLSSSGATGTRTATANVATTFQTVSVLVKAAATPAAPPYPGLLVSRLRPYFG